MSGRVLVLGATGMLGQPVVRSLVNTGHKVRMLVRSPGKARQIFGNAAEIVEGSALYRESIQTAVAGCDAVHINLPQDSELIAAQHVIDLSGDNELERITYVSATTACEENRWFELVDVKIRVEEILNQNGIPHVVFCPTWVMETLHNFIHGGRAAILIGKNPPPLHFFAAADFGRMVGASYEDDRALGKRLFVHGPEAITLPDAMERFVNACYPDISVTRMTLWQARLIAGLTGRERLAYITRLVDYFDKVGELGDPSEANALLDAPSTTLEEWFMMSVDSHGGSSH